MVCKICNRPKPSSEEWREHDHNGEGCEKTGCTFYAQRCWDDDDYCDGTGAPAMKPELEAAIQAVLAVPCKVEAENTGSYNRRVEALKKSQKPEDAEKLARLLAEGVEVCEGQWCAARKKLREAFGGS